MKITLSVLGGMALAFAFMSLSSFQPQENQNIPRYHIVAYGNGIVYDSVTGKAATVGGHYKNIKDGKITLKQILESGK